MMPESPTLSPSSETVVPVLREHIAVTPGVCGGKPRIMGHRIKVSHIAVWHERMGQTPAAIVAEHPGISLADVHAALAYYHDHKDEIDAELLASEEAASGLASQQPSLLEKIAARRPDVLSLSTRAALAYVRSGHCPAEDIDRLRSDLPRRLQESPAETDLEELGAELERRRSREGAVSSL